MATRANLTVKPELLKWARERASLSVDELAKKVGSAERTAPIAEWERTGELPVSKLEVIAAKTHAPYGMLFLPEPPSEPMPLHDFRRAGGAAMQRPSVELLDTIYECQMRMAWFSERLLEDGEQPLAFVSAATIESDPGETASGIRDTLRIGTVERGVNKTVADATLWMISRLAESGITVQRKGYASTNTHRLLDPQEFKGFALADKYAPFIFINGKDWPASQMFTIVHECVHLWLGESALPDGEWFSLSGNPTERFCNAVAAEVLMPADEVYAGWTATSTVGANAHQLATRLKVSSLAVLYRARNLQLISEDALSQATHAAEADFANADEPANAKGGNYYNNIGVHLGKPFIREVLRSTLEGRTLYSEAFQLLGTHKTSVFNELVKMYLASAAA